ncbi:NlpC/P60 family protein [Streptomyces sp. BI20]|uniref:C40 family peptidase n=1 Tax=Streptomyces sp. BI20 TaxID=3403460 RepID=UPI003C77D1EC
MNGKTGAGLGLGAVLVVGTLIGGLLMLGGSSSAATGGAGFGGGIATDAPVPGWLRTLVTKFGTKCPQITPSLIAAQLYTESGFDPKAVNTSSGAQGMAQFLPGTWGDYGVDGDGDGKADPFNPADAVASMANYDCVLVGYVDKIPGDITDLMLAAYNAGPGNVQKYGGIPPFEETRGYVKHIRELATKWAAAITNVPAGKGAAAAIAAAKTALGTWYVWGGSCVAPYTGGGGCDCSSLVQMAWGKAGVNLPRVTYDQVHSGTAVTSISALAPGDLLFTRPGPAGPEHVGMYIGANQVIEAPRTGVQVRIQPLSTWAPQIIAMRRVG